MVHTTLHGCWRHAGRSRLHIDAGHPCNALHHHERALALEGDAVSFTRTAVSQPAFKLGTGAPPTAVVSSIGRVSQPEHLGALFKGC
jgi:hypothetical protein